MRAAFWRLCFLHKENSESCQLRKRTSTLTGFNLYYGAAKHTSFKWVDLAALCSAVLPGVQINRIRYFTALVSAMPGDPNTRQRQETYIRALETTPNLSVHYGHYLASTVPARLAHPTPNGPALRGGSEDGGKGVGCEHCNAHARGRI